MGIFTKNNGGFMDEIRCDEQDYLIWKWHPRGSVAGANARENAIRAGSSLRVRDGQVAVFIYARKDGTHQDYIEGPADQIVDTENLPVLASLVGTAFAGGTPFQAEVYFINLARVVQARFAVPFFDVYDPRFLDFGVPVAVRGTVTFHIGDYRDFIRIHRLDSFGLETFKAQVKDAVRRYVKSVVANAPSDYGIPVVQIERHIAEINTLVEPQIAERLAADFAVEVTGVDIAAIELDKTSEGYAQLKAVTQDVAAQTIQAQTAANIRDIEARQRIAARHLDESLRIQREEGQYAAHKATQDSHFAAYQLETQAAVGAAGAEALGHMGSGGGANVGGGFNPAGIVAGIAMGGALGKNLASMMDGMTGSVASASPQAPSTTPPPIPTSSYHVAVGGQATGPYELATLAQMAANGSLTSETLVWQQGMPNWEKAGTRSDLASFFAPPAKASDIPPIPET